MRSTSFCKSSRIGRFERVTVRGPRSASLLADIGVDAEVVGDPALLVTAAPGLAREKGRIGVALGYGDSLRGGDHAAVVTAVADALVCLRREGHSVAFFVVNPSDRAHAVDCARQAGMTIDAQSVRLVDAADPSAFVSQVSTCDVIIAERLHAGILAAACGTLPIMLAYQPKVDDFMGSIGELEWSTPTDRLEAGALVEQVRARTIGAAVQRAALLGRIDHLRAAQAKVITAIGSTGRPRLRAVAS